MTYWPMEDGFIFTSPFGPRDGGFHYGQDFGWDGGSGGKPVFAAKAGVVDRAGPASGFGQWVCVDHPDGGYTVYGHVIPEVSVGDSVAAGQRIAHINPDSDTNGGVPPHLHMEWHRYTWSPPGPDRLDPFEQLKGSDFPNQEAKTVVDTLFADVSYFQTAVNDSYPYRVLSIRSNDGTFRDPAFAENYRWCVRAVDSGKLEFFIVYAYWRTNWQQTGQTLIDMVEAEGGPHPKMVVMIDLESGGNPGGDQSDGVNKMYWQWANWLGNPQRVIGYANQADFFNMWQDRPVGLRVIGAGYGRDPRLPGQIAHQYTDGQGYGGGLPEGAPPFGNCDMNSANGLSPQEFAAACGVGTAPVAKPGPKAIDVVAEKTDWLGARTKEDETPTPDGVGRFVQFANGYVYWHPRVGAHAVPLSVFAKFAFLGWEAGPLGYPRLDSVEVTGGVVQAFEGGIVYRKGTKDAHVVWGAIGQYFIASGYEKGPLGWPTSDEYDHGDGKAQDFEKGTVYWSPSNVVAVMKG